MKKLKFGRGNAKLGKEILTFSLPSGYTCPGSLKCSARFDRKLGMVLDGMRSEFRCYSASLEALHRNIRAMVDYNLELLKDCHGDATAMANLIDVSLPVGARIVRVHVGGDFFNRAYFEAWMRVARRNPEVRFYAYTKSLNFWVESIIADNFRLTASRGGKFDHLIDQYQLKTASVVFSIEEAMALGLEIDHDDRHAYESDKSFALLIHGQQKAGSKAGAAKRALKGVGSYSNKERKTNEKELNEPGMDQIR